MVIWHEIGEEQSISVSFTVEYIVRTYGDHLQTLHDWVNAMIGCATDVRTLALTYPMVAHSVVKFIRP